MALKGVGVVPSSACEGCNVSVSACVSVNVLRTVERRPVCAVVAHDKAMSVLHER